MTRIRNVCTALIAALAVTACASLPDEISELEQARAAVEAVDRQPMAERVAGAELRQAKDALRRAELARDNQADLEKIRHEAYMANRHAGIVSERIAEAEARERIEDTEAKRNEVLLQARTAEAERARAQAERQRAAAERQALRADTAMEQARQLEESLAELKAEQTERGLVLTLSDVLFDTNKADLKAGAANAIGRLAGYLSDNSERRLLIEGHTDARGEDAYNLSLSQRRAEAVRQALINAGVAPERLRAVGRGEAYPVASNDTSAGRQQNRRVEIIVSDQDGAFADSADSTTAMQ